MIEPDNADSNWIFNVGYFISMIVFAVLALSTVSIYNLCYYKYNTKDDKKIKISYIIVIQYSSMVVFGIITVISIVLIASDIHRAIMTGVGIASAISLVLVIGTKHYTIKCDDKERHKYEKLK